MKLAILRTSCTLRRFSTPKPFVPGDPDQIISQITPRWGQDFNPELKRLDLHKVKPFKIKLPVTNHCICYNGRFGEPSKLKTPVVFLHGLFGSTTNFRDVSRKLSDQMHRRMYAMDLRNHGASTHRGPHDYMTMAHDVIHTLQENKLKKVILAGHSMGAKVAMLVALLEPKFVDKLVVIDNSPINQQLNPRFYRQLVGLCHVEREVPPVFPPQRKNDFKLPYLLKEADAVLKRYEPDKAQRMFLLSGLRTNGKTRMRVPVLQFLVNNVLDNMGAWPEQEVEGLRYSGPVKVMKAKHSEFIDPTQMDSQFGKYFQKIDYQEFETGHWLVSHDPSGFMESLKKFITRPQISHLNEEA